MTIFFLSIHKLYLRSSCCFFSKYRWSEGKSCSKAAFHHGEKTPLLTSKVVKSWIFDVKSGFFRHCEMQLNKHTFKDFHYLKTCNKLSCSTQLFYKKCFNQQNCLAWQTLVSLVKMPQGVGWVWIHPAGCSSTVATGGKLPSAIGQGASMSHVYSKLKNIFICEELM